MSNSPFDLQTYTRKIGEFNSSSEVTWDFILGTPSIDENKRLTPD